MNQGFWMAKGAGCINDGELNYENSSGVEPKRSHQWFLDGAEADLFPNKKQAVAVPTANFFTGMLNSTIAPWSNGSSFQSMSSHYGERLFDTETDNVRAVNFDGRSIPSVNSDKVNAVRKFEEDSFDNDSPFGLSMSHSLEDPRTSINYGGIRKVKISQVKEPENFSSFPMEHAFNRVDSNVMSATHAYDKADENSTSMGLAYNKGDSSVISVGETYNSENNIFISMGQSYNKGDESISMNQAYKEGTNNVAIGVSNCDNNIISMGQPYNKAAESTISMGHIYNKGNDSTALTGQTYNKDESNNLSIGHSFNRGESTIISFGGCDADEDDTDPSGQIISSYDLLMVQSSLQRSEAINGSELITSNTDALMSAARIASSGAEIASKKKEDAKTSKKAAPNNFPSNVRSLLSTGMLDGVPVKYIAWSREKELRGVIKGSGYLCGCQECNFNKIVNAYEFERHANCKTKHPNNHIYFENGKTIYGIVQELRSTPQNMLFEVIQTITGSAINQKSFRLWKESFLAATRELQRIYGQDEGKPL